VAIVLAATAIAQQTSRRPLTHADYDSWRSIQGQRLSRDGRFLAYVLAPQDGDGEIVVRELASGKEYRHPRGAQPVNVLPPPTPGVPQPPQQTPAPVFTADSRFVIFQIQPSKAETEAAKRAKKKPEEMPKNAVGIMNLATGEVTRVEQVKSFKVPEEGPAVVGCILEPKPEPKPEAKPEQKPEEKKPEAERTPRKREKKKEYGSELVLKDLSAKTDRSFADVIDAAFSDDGLYLAYAVSSRKEETNGAFVIKTTGADAPTALLSGKGKYTKLTWDEKGTQLVFLSDRDSAETPQPRMELYYWDRKAAAAEEIVSADKPVLRPGMVISERGGINFSRDGGEVFFGVAPAPEPEKEEGDEPADEKVVADLWHYKDDFIQPMQRVRAERDRNRSYRSVYHLKDKRFVQLADEKMEEANPSDDGRWAIGSDDRPHRLLVGVDANYSDYYMVDTLTGSRKPILEKQQWNLSFSPGSRYAIFFDGKDWNSVSVPDGKITNLTSKLGLSLSDETHDSPGRPGSYGLGGWTADDKYVLIYDRYDIWQVAPDGSGVKNLTDSVGRKDKITFRYVRLDPEERSIDPARPLLLRAENEWTRESGFYRDRINGPAPERLVMSARFHSIPVKAKAADVFMLMASTFNEYPDLLITSPDFKELKKVSNANPQKEQLLWGSAELIRFKNLDGVPLSATLIKPENFDPSKKYPMIVYIYETLSEGLHRFVDPRPGHNINASYYASNGYLILMPDIVYTVGHPGQSAIKCVLPAIQEVADRGFLNESAIGIQGHSWGGYQIAYMITQTNRFKAASAGAPVANMTSAYSGIRWGTGLPRQFQYERTQSRIGGSLWESTMLFLENSPVFYADRVRTPLLMIHNDQDDAVPWYQGIEYFLALRRLGKEVYMFNYNGEFHGLRKRINQKDYVMRLQQFFDHHLKGAPKPEWMERGIPYLEREKEKEKLKPVADAKEKAGN
jgi:dipeptidyl aminopeptidase/acylaminoacyl peptidase